MRVPITKSKRHFTQRNKQALKSIRALTHLFCVIILCSCLPERFRHEKYDCSGFIKNIDTIIINKAKIGRNAKIISPKSEAAANITHIDEQTAWLTYKKLQIKINRKTGTITMIQGTNYNKLRCKKTVFKM